jgi:hypothetical protein
MQRRWLILYWKRTVGELIVRPHIRPDHGVECGEMLTVCTIELLENAHTYRAR